MSKGTRKALLLPALSAAVAILLLGYSAYGWYTLNLAVRATGMDVVATVPTILEISDSENGQYSYTVQVSLGEQLAAQTAGSAHAFDAQNDRFYLLPASSYEGVTVWQTDKADEAGAALCPADGYMRAGPVGYHDEERAFTGYYIDVTLWLRTLSDAPVSIALSQTQTEVISTEGDTITGVARAAFLNPAADGPSAGADALVFAPPSCNTTEVVTLNTGTGLSRRVLPAYLTFSQGRSEQTLLTLPASDGVEFSKAPVTVRLWIEGQDAGCVAALGGHTFSMKIGFVIASDS